MEASEAAVIRQHLIDPEICIRCNTCELTCPVGAISHDARNYVVDANICNLCMACVPPCPTGSIDNWRLMPRASAYTTEAQFGWDALPAELSAEELGAAGASEEARWQRRRRRKPRPAKRARKRRLRSAPTRPSSRLGPPRILSPTSMARKRRRDRSPPPSSAMSGSTEVGKEYDTHHIVLDFGAMPFPVLEGQSIGDRPSRRGRGRSSRITRVSIRSRARATASGPATTTSRSP